MHNSLKLAAVLVAVAASSASAQGRGRNSDGVPAGMRPPAGMCRVWINGLPAGQQPGVTDCATAQAQVRANSRVIYGASMNANVGAYTRKRQLADGSWVLERVRRDSNGNVVVLSSKPLVRNANGTWNNKRGDDNEANDNNGQNGDNNEVNGDNNDHRDRNQVRTGRKTDKEWKKNGKAKHDKNENHDHGDGNDNG